MGNRSMNKELVNENPKENSPIVFSFGETESVLNDGNALDGFGSYEDTSQGFWEPPMEKDGLARLIRANATHGSMAQLKTNLMAKYFDDSNNLVTYLEMFKMIMDWNVFGEFYFQIINNAFGQVIAIKHLPAVSMRVSTTKGKFVKLKSDGNLIKFKKGEVVQIKRYHLENEKYGCPEYLGAFQSILLGEESLLFKRRYYKNGAHMGFILFSQDPDMDIEVEEKLQQSLKDSKGVGNFKSMFVNVPNSTAKEPLKLIPIGEVKSSDDLSEVQKVTKENVVDAWRIPRALSNAQTENGNNGDIINATRAYTELEIIPTFPHIKMMNAFLPANAHVKFNEPKTSIFEES